MSPEQQRIAIAEACGIQDPRWSADGLIRNKLRGWVGPDDPTGKSVDVPDYCTSLDAMHEAEKVLTDDQQLEYINALCGGRRDGMWSLSWDSAFLCAHATAAQRAESFLRTLGLWREDK